MSCFLINSFRLYALTARPLLAGCSEKTWRKKALLKWAGMHSWWRRAAASSHPSLAPWRLGCLFSFFSLHSGMALETRNSTQQTVYMLRARGVKQLRLVTPDQKA